MRRLALTRPDVAISLTHNGRNLFQLALADAGRRIADILGRFIGAARLIEAACPAMTLSGFAIDPTRATDARDEPVRFVKAVSCATRSSATPCAKPIATCCTAAVSRRCACSSTSIRRWSTSMCTSQDRGAFPRFTRHCINSSSMPCSALAAPVQAAAALIAGSRRAMRRRRQHRQATDHPPLLDMTSPPNRCAIKPASAWPNLPRLPISPSRAPLRLSASHQLPGRNPRPSSSLSNPRKQAPPLGYALAQLHGIYILAPEHPRPDPGRLCTPHAAHPVRKLKAAFDNRQIATQNLLIPAVFSAGPLDIAAVEEHASLARAGFRHRAARLTSSAYAACSPA